MSRNVASASGRTLGATKTGHIDAALGALALVLTGYELAALEAPYVPHRVVGAA